MSTLRTFNLTKSYGGRTVVRGVNLDVSSGEIVGLLGPNGAGKTTTFYMTVGLTSPDSGRVELNGVDVTDDPMYVRARKGIGYLPQEPSIFLVLTVEQHLLAILETMDLDGPSRRALLRELRAELNLTPLARALGYMRSAGGRVWRATTTCVEYIWGRSSAWTRMGVGIASADALRVAPSGSEVTGLPVSVHPQRVG